MQIVNRYLHSEDNYQTIVLEVIKQFSVSSYTVEI